MPTLAATEDVSFYYTDSGAPLSPTYTTIVIIHGHTWHSAVFDRVLPLARAHNLRLVCVNRRLYPGSTPYTPEEAAEIASDDPSRVLASQGVLLARFIARLPAALQLPRPRHGRAGGMMLAGWSLGTLFVQLTLSAIDAVDEATRNILRTYVRGIVLWDTPSPFLGIDPPNDYNPFTDERVPPEGRLMLFLRWVSGYYTHDAAARTLCYERPDADLTPSVERMPDLLALTEPAASAGGDTALVDPALIPLMRRITAGALLDPQLHRRWGGLEIKCITGSRSVWNIVLAAWQVEDMAKKAGVRVEVKMIPNANHFVMWDAPEDAMRALLECCGTSRLRKAHKHFQSTSHTIVQHRKFSWRRGRVSMEVA
ncbi:Alpha/Beta hydrolase protein [Schizophyllum fasciatum]